MSLASLESIARPESAGGEEPVLRNVSFDVAPGTLTALVGPSGAGKTTITALLARLYDPTNGSVRMGNADVKDISFHSLRGALGVVTQDSHLFHDNDRCKPALRQA